MIQEPGRSSTLRLEIGDLSFPEGWGVAKESGFVFFVPGAIPGDLVTARLVRRTSRYGYAEVTGFERESPFRVTPGCPHFGTCGGCVSQNLRYGKQLELKEGYLRQTLRRIGDVDLERVEIEPIVPSVAECYYRSKIELFFEYRGSELALGFMQRVSPLEPYKPRVIPIESCVIFSRAVARLIPLVHAYAASSRNAGRVSKGGARKQGKLMSLTVRESKWDGRLMVCLEAAGGWTDGLPPFIDALTSAVPEMASLHILSGNKDQCLYGTPYIEEKLDRFVFRVFPETFFQPNSETALLLYRLIVESLGATGRERVLGLYCGAGPIEIFLSPFVKEVVGIDSSRRNIDTAEENCRINDVRNCRFYCARAEDILPGLISSPFDFVVVDPPRAGLAERALRLLLETHASRIIYVSCNPSTLARDLKRLREGGYVPTRIRPFDFFPHAAHLETFVLLERL
ncbi:MAG: methyltransferase [Deltaproteobacteria bacterium]|nr:methyltransferase [Deltaproteobacteria bacterium]